MKFGVSLPTVGPAGRRKYVLMVAQAADDLGFHSVWTSSHVALPRERKSTCLYPRAKTADAYNWGVAWLDPIVVMGAVVGATERVLVGSHVLAVPYRNPVILANEMASLDQLSQGRVILGAGLGWMDEEFATIGVPRRERGARMDEHIAVMRTLWSSETPTSFTGRFTSFTEMWLASRPYTATGPPIYIGGNSEPALRRVGRLGQGWLAHEVYPDEFALGRASLQRHAEEAGRDPDEIVLSVRRGLVPPFAIMDFMSDRLNITGTAEQVAEQVDEYRTAGATLLVLDLNMRPAEMVKTMEWFSKEVATLLH